MCQYANENTNLPDNDFIHKDKSFVGFVGFQADVTGFPVSLEGIFLEREVGILMKTVDHSILAEYWLEKLQAVKNVSSPCRRAFLFGNVQPDRNFFTYFHGMTHSEKFRGRIIICWESSCIMWRIPLHFLITGNIKELWGSTESTRGFCMNGSYSGCKGTTVSWRAPGRNTGVIFSARSGSCTSDI